MSRDYLETQIDELITKNTVNKERIAALEANEKELRGVINDAHLTLDSVGANRGSLNGRIQAQAERIAALEASLANERARLDEYVALIVRRDERIAALEAENARLRAALEEVEWTAECYCPWCGVEMGKSHRPDCQRQAALAQSEVKA